MIIIIKMKTERVILSLRNKLSWTLIKYLSKFRIIYMN